MKKELKEKIFSGEIICIAKTKKICKEGELFYIDNISFKITTISYLKLEDIARGYYQMAGFTTSQAFKQYWSKNNPGNKYSPEKRVYLHFFERGN